MYTKNLVLFFFLSLQACSITKDSNSKLKPLSTSTNNQPFILEILEEHFAENGLRVLVRLEGEQEWNTQNVRVGLRGLKDGEVVKEIKQKVSEFNGEKKNIAAKTWVEIPIHLEGNLELTDYQTELEWGEDKVKDQNPKENKIIIEDLVVSKLENDCGNEDCPIKQLLEFNIFNNTKNNIEALQLKVFYHLNEQAKNNQKLREKFNPETLQIVDLKTPLQAGERKKIKLKVNSNIQEELEKYIEPELTVLVP